MSNLKTKTVTVRGKEYTVREMSFKVRREWLERVKSGDVMRAVAFMAFAGTVEPAFATEEAVEEEAPEVVEALAKTVRILSGIGDGEPEEKKD